MKKILTTFFVVFILISINFAQARKIDEFGGYSSEDLQMRIENLRAELLADPKSFGQVLVYRSEKDTLGFPYKFGAAITSSLTFKSTIEKNRIIITNCKAEQKRGFEIWVMPKLQDLRTCENDFPNLDKTILFDSIYYNPDWVVWSSCCSIDGFEEEKYKSSLEAFAHILKNNPSVRAYMFFYSGTNIYWITDSRDKERPVRKLDSPKLINELVKKAKKILSEKGIESSRTVLINGGYKDSAKNVELWLVPQNGEIPKPKPNYFLKKK